jgi:hypothetical protein
VAPNSAFEAADVRIYKDGSATQRNTESGYTMTSPFDSVTGLHLLSVDLSDNTDAGFYAAGSQYSVILVPDETVDTLAVVRVLADFEIGPVSANATQFAGQTITAGAGVTMPATVASTTNITAGTITTATNVTTVNGLAAGVITAAAIATDAIDDDAIATGAITSTAFAAGAINAAAIAADAIGASELAADAVTEIQSGLATAAALTTIDDFLDTEIAAIKAVTDLLPDAGALTSLATQASVNTIDDFLDTEIAAIKAKTDNLPTDPADESNLTALITAVDDLVDTEVAAIKTVVDAIKLKTDSLTFTVANQVDANALTVDEDEILDDALTDSVPADGALPTVRQALYMILQFLTEKSVSGTTLTVKKVDGSTSLMTFTLDDGTAPTSITRTT